MSAAGVEAGASDGLNDVYEALERYNWDDDVEFQAGLSAILGSNSSPEQAAELALRARCFYYARKFNTTVDFEAYKAYRDVRGRPPPQTTGVQPLDFSEATYDTPSDVVPAPTNPSEPPAPYPTSFAHIVELITSGQPIPGIKEIPNTVLEGQGTPAEKPKRRKPWEKDEPAVAAEGGA
ncbi:hypothetical protein BU25DRAFT_435766 [Macroventuria anomochaeta]|uniref:Uncharacterized protein n=1 Tax=Macroventuria anomochaeta TaxID=301207 RepID=A0ACB6SGM7_9PLEO|nr:uncharacterized protein BU25DRAFT_435766 [Macroventuria anomochaeta]KAF2633184.1 hypothetical protein BU25DRAFT_435766 [Macroventuria anomochaeta]